MAGKAGLIVVLACLLACTHMGPISGYEDDFETKIERVQSDSSAVWVLIDSGEDMPGKREFLAGKPPKKVKRLRARGLGFGGEIASFDRSGKPPVKLDWKVKASSKPSFRFRVKF